MSTATLPRPLAPPHAWIPARSLALRITLAYLLLGWGWIFCSGYLVHHFFEDRGLQATLENAKGGMFVVVTALLLGLALQRYFSQIRHAAELLLRSEETSHELSAHLLQVQDLERRRVSRELHDTTAQHLAALGLNLSQLKRLLADGSPQAQALCRECLELANLAAREIRTQSYLLHPPLLEALGLADAVEEYAQGFSARSGIAVEVEVSKEFRRLPEEVELALFRVVQEGLANVLRHSGSACAKIGLTRQDSFVTLQIADSGQGIPTTRLQQIQRLRGGAGVGLGGMRERLRLLGGHLDLASGPAGTTVRATVPLTQPVSSLTPLEAAALCV